MIEIVRARASHLRILATEMRQADRDEIDAVSGMTPLGALMLSYRRANGCKVALADGRPVAIWGVGDLNILTATGAPWFLATEAVDEHRREFLRRSRASLAEMTARYDILRNLIDCRNRASVRWLKWLGFEFSQPFDWRGHRVMVFEMRTENVR